MKRITVTIDGRPYDLFAGAEVWMVVDQLPLEEQQALKDGGACLVDRFGNEVGLAGALSDGQALRVSRGVGG